tara:strand:+ start:808 stop:1059 length:252 start_codon:yes stop_codon:yes gene_type:complete
MGCNLFASITGSFDVSVNNLLQSDYTITYIDPNYHWTQALEASITGSLNASINPVLEASITQNLQASTVIVLRAKYCNRIVAV